LKRNLETLRSKPLDTTTETMAKVHTNSELYIYISFIHLADTFFLSKATYNFFCTIQKKSAFFCEKSSKFRPGTKSSELLMQSVSWQSDAVVIEM